MDVFLSSVIARRDEQVRQHGQLVLGETLLVLLPVVLVGALELLKGLLHARLQREGNDNLKIPKKEVQ